MQFVEVHFGAENNVNYERDAIKPNNNKNCNVYKCLTVIVKKSHQLFVLFGVLIIFHFVMVKDNALISSPICQFILTANFANLLEQSILSAV